jgi:S-layer family protein
VLSFLISSTLAYEAKRSLKTKKIRTNEEDLLMKRKLIASIIVMAMILSMVGVGFAAPVASDVVDTDYEDAVAELSALNILNGYPDGTFRPEKTVTRAEFAKIAVLEIGLAKAVDATKGNTVFSDVTVENWAAPYVKLATERGLLKGYPDGTFKPEANVTYAEASTILVRILGFNDSMLTGAWPSNYLGKAAQVGVTDDVAISAGASATRGDVAIMADNTLTIKTVEQITFGNDPEYNLSGPTILNDIHEITIDNDTFFVKETPVVNGNLDSNEVNLADKITDLAADWAKYDVVGNIDIETLLGHEVTIWTDEDGDIVFMNDEEDADNIFVDTINKIAATSIELTDKDDTYSIAKTTTVAYNADVVTWDDVDDLGIAELEDAKITCIMDNDDNITYARIIDADRIVGLVDEVDVKDETITLTNGTTNGTVLKFENRNDYRIVKDGEEINLEDIQEKDVVNIFAASTKTLAGINDTEYIYLVVTSDTAAGNVTKAQTKDNAYWATIDGEKHGVVAVATYEFGNDSELDAVVASNIVSDIIADDVTAYLDMNGYVVKLESDVTGTDDDIYGVITSVSYKDFDEEVTFKAYTTADAKATFSFEADALADVNDVVDGDSAATLTEGDIEAVGFIKHDFVRIDLNSAGEVSEIEILAASDNGTVYTEVDGDVVNETGLKTNVDDSRLGLKVVNETTPFFYYDGSDWDVMDIAEFGDDVEIDATVCYKKNSTRIVRALVATTITDGAVGGDIFGVVADAYYGAGGDSYVDICTTDDEVITLNANDVESDATVLRNNYKDEFVKYERTGDDLDAISIETIDGFGEIDDVDSNIITLTVGFDYATDTTDDDSLTEFRTDADTVIFDNSNDNEIVDGLSTGDQIQVYLGTGDDADLAQYIVIFDDDDIAWDYTNN